MIKITIDDEARREIEEDYWNWFASKHLKKFKKRRIKNEVKIALFGKSSFNEEDIKMFLLAPPCKLHEIKEKIDKLENKNNTLVFSKMMKSIYKDYRKNMASKIVRALKIKICPYCNQNYILSYDEESVIFTGEIDHFFAKSTYTLLQICLYNLIPVCGTCNNLKGDKGVAINNPFDEDYSNRIIFKTNLELKDYFDFMKLKSDQIKIVVDDSIAKEDDKNEKELFKLDKRYNGLQTEALMVIKRTNMYTKFYQKTLKQTGIDISDLKKSIIGYGVDDNQVSLSKFNRDIMNQFDKDARSIADVKP